ncbi:MAG: hypothetical protein U0P45_04245 [Acidimicrobiales bacterium]
MKKAVFACFLLLAGVLVGSSSASATVTIKISGTVRCKGGHEAVGVWVTSSAGGKGFANFKKAINTPQYGKSMGYYWKSLTISGSSTSISLHVGCGYKSGTTSWWSDNYSPSITINSSRPLNTSCTESAGAGANRCGTPSVPSIGNRIADLGLTYVGGSGKQACIDSGQSSNGIVGGYSGGQCRQFVNCLLYRASWHRYTGAASDYSFPGATKVSATTATRGDIIQYGIGGHTAVILRNDGAGKFLVVDSNYSNNEKVQVHSWTPPTTAKIWRYSSAASG